MANEQDKDNDMQENKKDKSRKSAIITGVICVLLCIIGALYIWHKQTQKPPVQLDVNSAIATVDIDKLMSKHSDYAKLEKLQAEKILILIKLKSYALNTEQLQPPQVNPASQVFEQVVDEQNNLQEIKIVTDKMMKLDKKTRLKVSSNDEVGELKQQINDLYSTLLRTIDDLEFKNKEILKLEKLKYDFFKGASHELKTPLASLKIILENMKYNIGKYKERDIYINECIEIVDSLTKNISQILSVHSIENLNNDEEYLKINDTLEDILKKYEILANQKKITVNNYILDENIYIGKTALKIILSNLISNAVKYTDVNGVINIGIVNDWLYIENTYGNNKISNMDKIFDVKFDLNKENSNGLGLYIVSNILNNYNMEYKALQDEEFFIFKIKIFS